MPQQQDSVKPLFLNLDSSFETMQKDESSFIRDFQWDINGNANLPTGTGNPSGEGQNEMSLTPTRSNVQIPNSALPTGYNKCVGTFESKLTKELYYLNYNDGGQHGIYVISGDTLQITPVVIDPTLNFTLLQDGYFTDHRCTLRVRYDENKNIIEKYFIATNGNRWQLWINVLAAIATNGFNATAYPYYTLQPPLFDRRELLEYPVRPPMQEIVATSQIDTSKTINNVLDFGFEFCYQFVYTDGRETTISPLSVPNIIQSQSYLANPNLLPNEWALSMYAGSCMVEKINLFYRFTKKEQNVNAFVTWSDWYLYDTIYKFDTVIPNNYWLRTNAWFPNNNSQVTAFDRTNNVLTYIFDNTKLGQITDQSLFAREQSNMPILSVAMSDLGDSILLGNNQYGYDNIPEEITNKISISVQEQTNNSCTPPTRHIRLYAVALAQNTSTTIPQVGYYNSADSVGMRIGINDKSGNLSLTAANTFNMTFGASGENNAYVCYLKGTPYFAVGNWYVADASYNLTEITTPLDYQALTNKGTAASGYIANVFSTGGFFVCVFDFYVPAGYYLATIGRHNISLNGNFRGLSTYIMGLYSSRSLMTNLPPAVNDYSKEMEVDCTGGDFNNWGVGNDIFKLCVPTLGGGSSYWHFVEGYIYDTHDANNPFELLDMTLSDGYSGEGVDMGCTCTDANGFYWGASSQQPHPKANVFISGYFVCGSTVRSFIINPPNGDNGYLQNGISYVQDQTLLGGGSYNNFYVNAFVYKQKITDSTGNIDYSNIGVAIKDGAIAYTDENGIATLVIHNSSNSTTARGSAGAITGQGKCTSTNFVTVTNGGNFSIIGTNCLPLSQYNELPFIPTSYYACHSSLVTYTGGNIAIKIISGLFNSLKQQGSYSVGIVLADLALRVTSVQKVQDITVSSFCSRQDTNPTYFQWNFSGNLNLDQYAETKNAAYLGFFVTKAINYKKYIQWVGDSITNYNSSGNVVTQTALATYVAISLQSLLETNIQNNLNLLATYQFSPNDRLRIYDNGAGQLLSSVIDVPILGTTYNQAAINAQLISPPTNTVLASSTPSTSSNVNLFVEYDSRFAQLQNKTGFWIEIYSPLETNELTPFFQSEIETDVTVTFAPIPFFTSWMPIINGEPSVVFNGNNYFPTMGKLKYWDTYFLNRSITIPNSGLKFFTHPFESPNITDTWGVNAASGGNPNTINPYAKQMFYLDDTIKSDDYVSQGLKNGLATFRDENRKVFKGYGRGGIMAIKTHYQLVFFLCENDWFMTDFNFNYVYANAQGVQIANLDNAMGTPHQKIGDNYGCAYGDTSSVLFNDKYALWHDKRNEGFIYCDFRQAKDITDIQSEGRSFGIKSYYCKKSLFVSTFNETHNVSNRIDVVTGIDLDLELIYVTFRPRRNNSKDINTFVNDRRNLQINYQETLVYSINSRRWLRLVGFTPESYGTLRGNTSGRIMVSFAQGIPYTHGNLQNSSYCNFFGVNVAPVISAIINVHPEATKTLQSISLDINNQPLWVDMIYSNLLNTFSYLPVNFVKSKEGQYYAAVQANMNSYPNPNTAGNDFRSMLLDGNKMRGVWFLVRFVADLANVVNGTNVYSELNNIYYKYTVTGNTNK